MATTPPDKFYRITTRAIVLLGVLAVVGVSLIAATNLQTRERIARNEREFLLRGLNQLIPSERYDNDLFTDVITVVNQELLGSPDPVRVYRARKSGAPLAAIIAATTPNGYSGPIDLLVGINYDGSLIGVRISDHRETPGLGDKIDIDKSNWLLAFKGLRIDNPPAVQWTVKKEGGYFDQFTGATVTPRAVVIAVYNTLLFFDNNRDLVFSVTNTDDVAPQS